MVNSSKNLFNKKYVKFIIKLMSKIVFFVKNKSITKKNYILCKKWDAYRQLHLADFLETSRWTNDKTGGY